MSAWCGHTPRPMSDGGPNVPCPTCGAAANLDNFGGMCDPCHDRYLARTNRARHIVRDLAAPGDPIRRTFNVDRPSTTEEPTR